VARLQQAVPVQPLGDTIALDTKHILARVAENNPKAYVSAFADSRRDKVHWYWLPARRGASKHDTYRGGMGGVLESHTGWPGASHQCTQADAARTTSPRSETKRLGVAPHR